MRAIDVGMLAGVVGLGLACGLLGGGKAMGEPCTITGSGFQRTDDCAHWCMEHWPVTCADGSTLTWAKCSGPMDCDGGGCAEDEVCYQGTNSSSVCLPRDVCASGWDGEALR